MARFMPIDIVQILQDVLNQLHKGFDCVMGNSKKSLQILKTSEFWHTIATMLSQVDLTHS